MEAQSQEMQAEYQRLRARIQKMPQADDQSAAGFGASVALAASVGVAAMKKYSSHGQQESEFTSDSQISLVPQRAGLVTASAARSGDVRMFEEGDIGVLPPLGVFDP